MGLEWIPADTGPQLGTPWISRQFVTGLTQRHKQPLTRMFLPMDKGEQPTNPTCLWIVGGGWSTWREATQTGENMLTVQRGPAPDTALPCYPYKIY